MTSISWDIRGPEFSNCNCAWGCPCQFNAPPTDGTCKAVFGMRIDEGHFGGTRLDGLCWAATLSWPGAIHMGNGACQFVIDERANDAQRHGLGEIVHGRETLAGVTHFQVFASTMSHVHDPLFLPIEFEANVDECRARLVVPGVIESVGMPMKSPFGDKDHRVRVSLRDGFDYSEAEFGSGSTKTMGVMKMEFQESYGQFAYIRLNQNGVVR